MKMNFPIINTCPSVHAFFEEGFSIKTEEDLFRATTSLKYTFNYPEHIFTGEEKLEELPSNSREIIQELSRVNPYFTFFPERNLDMAERIKSLRFLKDLVINETRRIFPGREIVSLYACGGYIYNRKGNIPNDVDIKVILDGNAFFYIQNIPLPNSIRNKLMVPIKYVSINFYGRDNMEQGILVGKEESLQDIEIKREAAMGAWRNVVLFGNKFILPKNSPHNVYAAKLEMLMRCHMRLKGFGHYALQDKQYRLGKLACRFYSLGVFSKFLSSEVDIDLKRISKLPVLTQNGQFSFAEAEYWYKKMFETYKNLKEKYA